LVAGGIKQRISGQNTQTRLWRERLVPATPTLVSIDYAAPFRRCSSRRPESADDVLNINIDEPQEFDLKPDQTHARPENHSAVDLDDYRDHDSEVKLTSNFPGR
jgi:hypothetical protein